MVVPIRSRFRDAKVAARVLPLMIVTLKVILGSLMLRPRISSKIGDFSKMMTQKQAALRATDRSRSPRRVDKIDGEHAEGLPWKKVMAYGLKDCQMNKESADAERQTKVARRDMRSKFPSDEGWWAVVAAMASNKVH